jgi:hypothetical protein
MYPRLPFHTYKKGRKCLFCKEAIPDQAHKSRKFCPRSVLKDGSVEDHKDDFHAARRKEEDAPFIRIGMHQKLMDKRIEILYKKVGGKVSVQQLQEYGINLYRPIEINPNSGSFTFYFFRYAIEQLNPTQAKIYQHGKQF